MTFSDEIKYILCNVRRPILILVAKVWRHLNYVKYLQAKYFTGENIPIYGMWYLIEIVLDIECTL